MYPEELSGPVDSGFSRDGQWLAAVRHAASAELADCLRVIRHCCEQLTDEQIWWRPDASMNSIGNLLLHLAGNLRQWVVAGLGNVADTRDRPSEFAAKAGIPATQLLADLEACVASARETLSNVSSEALLQSKRIQGFELTGIAALWHTVPHFRGHTQEMICLTRQQLGSRYRFGWAPQTAEQGAPPPADSNS